MAGHHASLLHHFSKTTCLFVGLSLQDQTLRHLLRQSAVISPGHFHYYVQFVHPNEERDPDAERAVRAANFEVYNLVTLFLGNEEIAALGELLTVGEARLIKKAEEIGVPLKYFYYLSGAIGAGKTTCLGYLGSFKTYEEWMSPRPPDLGKSWNELNNKERNALDEWIVDQFELRNSILINQKMGIHVCDRSPLDPLSFNEQADMKMKANFMSKRLSPGKSKRELQRGEVILLTGVPDDLEGRVISRHKQSSAALISGLQNKLQKIFENPRAIETFNLSIADVVKRAAHIILMEEYSPYDLWSRLRQIERDGVS
jgi:hypothetical protein